MVRFALLFAFLICLSTPVFSADECASCGEHCVCESMCACNHEPRAPIGVMGDHVHHKGRWMAAYRYMFMKMDGIDGDVSGYMMRPESMDMHMHMLGVMYTPIENLTIGLMLPYIQNEMDMRMGPMNMPMKMNSEGVGDVKLNSIYRLWATDVQQLLLNLGLSFPTGSIDEEDAAGNRLPYPMQLGSGSYGLVPGITYSGLASGWGWGAQVNSTIYLNENDNDYTLGNRYGLQVWGLKDLSSSSALSIRLNGMRVDNIDGTDLSLNPMMSPLADPELRAGTRMDLMAGVDLRKESLRLALEAGTPVYQELDGPQLQTDWLIIGGLQLSF